MNWGTGIIISFVLFMSFILYLVYGTFQQNIDLVAEDYYQQEIAYQTVIDESNNYQELVENLKIEAGEHGINFTFPHEKEASIKGEIAFYRPANKVLDQNFAVDSTEVFIEYSTLTQGLYVIKTSWTVDKNNYFKELSFFVQK